VGAADSWLQAGRWRMRENDSPAAVARDGRGCSASARAWMGRSRAYVTAGSSSQLTSPVRKYSVSSEREKARDAEGVRVKGPTVRC